MTSIFAGTFNPFTIGHLEIVKKALSIFSNVIIAVADDNGKTGVKPLKDRIEIATLSTANLKGVQIIPFKGLLTDFLKSQNSTQLVRGLRGEQDIIHEQTLQEVYTDLLPNINITYFLTPNNYRHISSSLVRELASLNAPFENYVCKGLADKIIKIYNKKEN